jgi:endogenous inhibitor of DNA gyrase (YacG/DUF329 family)
MLQKFREGQARTRKRKEPQATEERGRRSPRGKAKLKEKYEERKRWLDELKAERECCLCGKKNPLVLRFHLRGEKVKFSPELKNLSRNKKDWLEVIRHCEVICLNCLARKKAIQKSGKRLRKVSEGSEMSRQSIVNDGKNVHGVLLWPNTSNHTCKTCGAEFKSKSGPRKREFCSDRCRLLHWAAREVIKAFRAGQAKGLQGIIAELAEVRR